MNQKQEKDYDDKLNQYEFIHLFLLLWNYDSELSYISEYA